MTDGSNSVELQRTVQRLLGRCLLRIQQYERLVKAMVAEHELAGPVEALAAQREHRIGTFSDKTLGTLVKSLFETYIVPDGFARELLPEGKVPSDRISMAFSVRLSMEPEKWTLTKAAIDELVTLRNDMVHHLVDRFDVWTDDGCIAATSYLEEGYQCIDRRFGELAQWAKTMMVAREMAASLSQTEAFRDLLINGIEPDGSIAWRDAGVVRALREAAVALSVDGWARLDDASSWMQENHSAQTPAKYGCRSWPHVLGESRQFDLVYRLQDGRKVGWFRPRLKG